MLYIIIILLDFSVWNCSQELSHCKFIYNICFTQITNRNFINNAAVSQNKKLQHLLPAYYKYNRRKKFSKK